MSRSIAFYLRQLLPLAAILLLTFWLFSPSLSFAFVWDDFAFIPNWDLAHNFSANWLELLTGSLPLSHAGVYRPVRSLLYALSYLLWGTDPWGYHFQAILIHLSVTSLVYFLTYTLTRSRSLAFTSTLLFALHPVHLEAIAFVTTSFDIVGVFFLMISFLFYLHRHRQQVFFPLSLIFAFLATFTYELALILPFLLIAYHFFYSSLTKKTFHLLLPFFLIHLSYWLLRFFLVENVSRLPGLFAGLVGTLLVMTTSLLQYLNLLFLPLSLSVSHLVLGRFPSLIGFDLPTSQFSEFNFHPLYLVGPLFFLLLFFLIWRLRSKPFLAFSLSLLSISFLPVLQFFPQTVIFAEKYTYLPSVAFIWIIAYILHLLSPLWRLLILINLSLVYFFLSSSHLPVWSDSSSLWQHAVSLAPYSASAHTNLAQDYLARSDPSSALPHLLTAVALNSEFPLYHQNLSKAYQLLGEYNLALSHLDQAIALDSQNPDLHYSLGFIHQQLGNYSQAINAFQTAHQLSPSPLFLYQIAQAYHTTQDLDLAIQYYHQVLDLQPHYPDAHNNLGNIYQAQGKLDLALTHFRLAIDLDPNHQSAQTNLTRLENSIAH